MASLKQLPTPIDIYMVKGDDFTFSIHSDINLSHYTLSARCGELTFKVTPITAFDYNITITAQQANNIVKEKTWTLEWIDPNGEHRTVFKGTVRVE